MKTEGNKKNKKPGSKTVRSESSVLDYLLDPVARFNSDLHLVYCNPAFLQLTGKKQEEVIGKTCHGIGIPSRIATEWTGVIERVFETNSPGEMASYYPVGEEIVYLTTKMVPEPDEAGATQTVLAISRDVSDIKKKERQLKESRDLLQHIIDAPNLGIGVFKAIRDEQGAIIDFVHEFVNRRSIEAMGGADVAGMRLSEWGSDGTGQIESFKRVIETGESNSYTRNAESGVVEGWFLFSNASLGNDQLVQVWEDITGIKKAEQEILRLKEEVADKVTDKYLTLFNSIDQGFALCELIRDEEGKGVDYRILELNPAFEKQTGVAPDTLLDRNALEVFPALDKWWVETYTAMVDSGGPVLFEHYFEDVQRWYEIGAYPMQNDQFAVLYNNISERKRRDKQQQYLLKLSDALRQLSDAVEIEDAACRLLGEYLEADRVYYIVIDEQKAYSTVEREYLRGSSPSIAGVYPFASYGSSLDLLRQHKPVVAGDIYKWEIPAAELAAMENIQLISLISVPLIKKGELKGALAVSDNVPRAWKPEEVELVQETLERMWAAAERARSEKALRRSEEGLRLFITASSNMVYRMSADWSRMENLVGKELLADTPEPITDWASKYILPEDQSHVLAVIGDAIASRSVFELEHRVLSADGSIGWVHSKAIPLLDEQGEITTWFGTCTDITQRRSAALHQGNDLLKSAAGPGDGETAGTKDIVDALRINEERTHGLKEAFQSVVNGASLANSLSILSRLAINELAGEARTAFYMANAAGTELHTIRGAGNMPDEYADEIDGFLIGPDSLGCGLAVPTGKPVTTTDVKEEPLWKPWLRIAAKYDYRGCWSFPIKTKDNKAVGTFTLYFREPREAAAQDLSLADTITQAAAVIISGYTEVQERRKAEDALHRSQEELWELNVSLEQLVAERTADLVRQHSLLMQAEELAQAGSWEYDVTTKEFTWSDGMYELFKIRKGSPVTPAIYLERVIAEDQAAAGRIVDAIRKKFRSFEETIRIRPDGHMRTVRIKAAPFFNADGGVAKMLGVDVDISRSVAAEEEIRSLNQVLVEKNRVLESLNTDLKSFTSIAINDYGETLRQLYLHLELIITNDARSLSNSGRANLRRAQGAIQKMKLITDDLVSFLKLQQMGIRDDEVELDELLKEVLKEFEELQDGSGIDVRCDPLPAISGYRFLLALMFQHLLENAIKFRKSDEGHQVIITCRESVSGDGIHHLDAQNDRRYHLISIQDNGIGFPAEEAEQIFGMFYRHPDKKKYKGSGIGLAISRKIMQMHGGFITAEAGPGKGARFSCYFPVL